MPKPTLAITMGDPAGIGPEIVVKVLSDETLLERCHPVVVGDPAIMADACSLVGGALSVYPVETLSQAVFAPARLNVLCPQGLSLAKVALGAVNPACGRAAALCIEEAFYLAMGGKVQGVVTAPMSKEAFRRAGYNYLDELHYMADLTGSDQTLILGAMRDVWAVTVAEHVAFRDIASLITCDRVLWYTLRLHETLVRLGYENPRIAVAALNVHGGEGGLLGREELDEIGPAIEEAREQGISAVGPIPADTVFARALAGEFDGVVAMYHDQANIARKLQPMQERATIFMGLPVPCATTAHGTAFDIAGKGIADPGSLKAALNHTIALSR